MCILKCPMLSRLLTMQDPNFIVICLTSFALFSNENPNMFRNFLMYNLIFYHIVMIFLTSLMIYLLCILETSVHEK